LKKTPDPSPGSAGKVGTAPCGHPGRHVIGTYVQCLHGCDAPEPDDDDFGFLIDEEITAEHCMKCGSSDVEDFALDPVYYALNPGALIVTGHCNQCGAVW
jgi:hypothetical protein